eukprot:scaffold589_cov118-Isochrysis_galbana.AAC.6
MFNLKSVKETTCHSIMTQQFISGGGLASANDLMNAGVSADDVDTIVSNAAAWGCISPCDRVDMVKYNLRYCMGDVRLLRDGVRAFMDGVEENMNINGWCYSTIAGIADAYFTGRGSYDGVCLMWGVNRDYVAQSAVGGRVMARGNWKLKFSRPLGDFDAVSLYPSAIKRIAEELGGFPTGNPTYYRHL